MHIYFLYHLAKDWLGEGSLEERAEHMEILLLTLYEYFQVVGILTLLTKSPNPAV
jgi:hypothetical protein